MAEEIGNEDMIQFIKHENDRRASNSVADDLMELRGVNRRLEDLRNEIKILKTSHQSSISNLVMKHEKESNFLKSANAAEMRMKEDEIEEKESIRKELQSKLTKSVGIDPGSLSLVPECPVCLDPMAAPVQIFTCSNGHLVCGDCGPQVPGAKCVECQVPYTGRATGMEKTVRRIMNLE